MRGDSSSLQTSKDKVPKPECANQQSQWDRMYASYHQLVLSSEVLLAMNPGQQRVGTECAKMGYAITSLVLLHIIKLPNSLPQNMVMPLALNPRKVRSVKFCTIVAINTPVC